MPTKPSTAVSAASCTPTCPGTTGAAAAASTTAAVARSHDRTSRLTPGRRAYSQSSDATCARDGVQRELRERRAPRHGVPAGPGRQPLEPAPQGCEPRGARERRARREEARRHDHRPPGHRAREGLRAAQRHEHDEHDEQPARREVARPVPHQGLARGPARLGADLLEPHRPPEDAAGQQHVDRRGREARGDEHAPARPHFAREQEPHGGAYSAVATA